MSQTRRLRLLLPALLLLAQAAGAQIVYRSVDPKGHVSYSDQPPVAAAPARSIVTDATTTSSEGGRQALPYVLTQAIGQYPVTLYTGPQCGSACNAARAMLVSRGVPFNENTVTTQQDIDVLKRIGGDNGQPFLTIGGQHLRGYSEVEWNRYLDAAGYPLISQLPPGYRFAPAAPLTQPASEPRVETRAVEPAVAPARTLAPTPSNPAGIQF
jgi:glutaredoxin